MGHGSPWSIRSGPVDRDSCARNFQTGVNLDHKVSALHNHFFSATVLNPVLALALPVALRSEEYLCRKYILNWQYCDQPLPLDNSSQFAYVRPGPEQRIFWKRSMNLSHKLGIGPRGSSAVICERRQGMRGHFRPQTALLCS